MKMREVVELLDLEILTSTREFLDIDVSAGYTSDMLSCVMTGAENGSLWVTLMANLNIVAVATLLEIPAIIITENAQPDAATIARANQEGIVLLSTSADSFQVVSDLSDLGIKSSGLM